jgi:3-oxoisoapionate decarboxylase
MSDQPPGPSAMDRRMALRCLAGSVFATTWGLTSRSVVAAAPAHSTAIGLVIHDCALRRKGRAQQSQPDLFEPLTFLTHCQQLGAGGMQAALGVLDADRVRTLRDFAGEHGLFVDGIVSPPKDAGDVDRFAAEIRTAAEVGVQAVRTVVLPGRRYEQFRTLAEFRDAETHAVRMLERAVPIVDRHRVRLAVENNKDQRIDERLALYQRFDSEYLGACVDTGNSFALLDDPYGAIEALAPYAFTVHLKDQAVRETDEGFLLGDIPLGQGCFDLPRMVGILQRAKPRLRFVLELITRDPLRVNCLTDGYWATMPHVSGQDLARTLRIVREHPAHNLQMVSPLPLDQQVQLEDANLAASLQYARETLKLA